MDNVNLMDSKMQTSRQIVWTCSVCPYLATRLWPHCFAHLQTFWYETLGSLYNGTQTVSYMFCNNL